MSPVGRATRVGNVVATDPSRRAVRRSTTGFVLVLLIVPALLFLAAGTVRWPEAWTYVGLMTAGTVASRLVMARRSPDTLVERARFGSVENVQPGDRGLVAMVVLGPVIVMLTAGLDRRFGGSPPEPFALRLGAALLIAAALAFAARAMAVNRWFSAVARIQYDRAQRVVDTGPYAVVRHPAYAASLVATMAAPVLLGSRPALIPAALTALAIVVRTAREDRMLRDGLPGYESYARATRARLVPGVW